MEVKCWFCDGKGGDFEHYVSRSHNDMDWIECECCSGKGKIDIPEEIIEKVRGEEKDKTTKKMFKELEKVMKAIEKHKNCLCVHKIDGKKATCLEVILRDIGILTLTSSPT